MAKGFRAVALGLVLLAGTALPAMTAEKEAMPGQGGMQTEEELAEKCRQMMEKRQAMREEMVAMDARLQELTKEMNAASGDRKIEATAAVVNQLVTQHLTMRRHMETMGPEMMKHMSEHMSAGMSGKSSMMECPMMQEGEGSGVGSSSAGEHSDHLPK